MVVVGFVARTQRRRRHTPGRSRIARSLLLVGVVSLAACGGRAGSAFPAAGHASPPAAVIGLLAAATSGDISAACGFVAPKDAALCRAGLATAGLRASGLRQGATTIRADEALVSVIGKICVNGEAAASCSTNTSETGGQPGAGGPAAFAAAFSAALEGSNSANPAVPCVRLAGRWYVDLGS